MPPTEYHDEFLELCAIATTGSLSAEEEKRLKDHLSECPSCRERLAQYEALIARVVPALAGEQSFNKDRESADWDLEQGEAKLFARLADDDATSSKAGFTEKAAEPGNSSIPRTEFKREDGLWSHIWWQYAAGLLAVATLGLATYGIGSRRGTETAKLIQPPPAPMQMPLEAHTNPIPVNEGNGKEIAELRVQLETSSAEIARLKSQQAQMGKDLSDRDADRIRLEQDKAEVARQLALAQTNLDTLEQKLNTASSAQSQNVVLISGLQEKVNQLTETLRGRDQELAREQELLDHDRDIRELVGARDMYMAEVYDVDASGTKKPFTRVFYSKARSLTVYGFDLDQQPGIKNASTFQVWGRRGPNEADAVNLGIMYLDSATAKRWVLKSNSPKMLAQIDAVFVTVEPNGGSQHPSGKPFLFAYLKVEPNHP